MSIVTLPEVKDWLRISTIDRDDVLQGYADAVTVPLERHVHEVVEAREFTDRRSLTGERRFRVWHTPLISLTSIVTIDGVTSFDVSAAAMSPTAAGVVDVLPAATAPTGLVDMVTRAGYDPVPEEYRQAALLVIQHLYETLRGHASTGRRGGVVGGEEGYDPRYSYLVPRKIAEILPAPTPLVG